VKSQNPVCPDTNQSYKAASAAFFHGKKGGKRLAAAATVDEILRSLGGGIRDFMESDRYRTYLRAVFIPQ